MKQILTKLKGKIDNSTITVGDFNILSIMGRTSRQKINKEIEDWNNAINQVDLTDMYTTLYLTTAEYTFF